MFRHLRSTALFTVFTLLAGTGVVAAQPGRPPVNSRPQAPLIAVPNTAPPPQRAERPGRARRGMVYVEGRWDWQNGNWVWVAGKWEKQPRGKRHRAGQWAQQGDHWAWNADAWEDAPLFPTAPPPAPLAEVIQRPRRGYVWVAGNYDWKDGAYAWTPGHWERQKAGQTWIAGQWSLQGDHYVWVAGRWQ